MKEKGLNWLYSNSLFKPPDLRTNPISLSKSPISLSSFLSILHVLMAHPLLCQEVCRRFLDNTTELGHSWVEVAFLNKDKRASFRLKKVCSSCLVTHSLTCQDVFRLWDWELLIKVAQANFHFRLEYIMRQISASTHQDPHLELLDILCFKSFWQVFTPSHFSFLQICHTQFFFKLFWITK